MTLHLPKAVLALIVVAVAGLTGCQEDLAETHRLKGNELFKKEQWAKAAEEYRSSLEADPKQEKLWDKLAATHMRAGQTNEAVQALLKTIDFKPDPQKKAEVYRNVGGLLLQSPKPFDAEQYFLEAVKLEPNDDASLLWLGEMESQRGGARNMQAAAVREHLDKAIAYYDRVITAKPDALVAYVNKRIALIKLINEEKRQKDTTEVVALATRRNTAEKQEALTRVAQHQARIDELKAKADELSAKITELQKKGVKLK